MQKIIKSAAIDSLLTGAYISAVAIFMNFAGKARIGVGSPVLAPVAMLLLFVTSAAITSWLVFGKPAQMFLDGKKKEALSMLGYTLGFLFVLTFIAIFSLVVFGR